METLKNNKTFETFTENEKNQYAVIEARAFAVDKGEHNLLYIHGAEGSGKSHLLNAIGIETLSNSPDALILKTSFEEMTNDLMSALSNEPIEETINAFRNKYKAPELLIIDDVDKVKGKKNSHKELAYLLKEILEEKKRVVVAGRLSPETLLQREYDRDFAEVMRSGYTVGTTTEFAGSDNRHKRPIVRDVCEILDKYKYNNYSVEEEVLWRYDIVIPFAKGLELRINCNPRNEYVRFRLGVVKDPNIIEEKRIRLLEACDNVNRTIEFLRAITYDDCVSVASEIPPKVGDALEHLVMEIVEQYDRDLDLELFDMAINTDEDLYEYTVRKMDELFKARGPEYERLRRKHNIP